MNKDDCPVEVCTVKDLIEHLQNNFKPTDKLCRWYEGGAYMNCEHLLKYQLNDLCFLYVKNDKLRLQKMYGTKHDDIYKDCGWINDDDVVI